MSLFVVPTDRARAYPIVKGGVTILLNNQSAVDVYYDSNPNRLNATVAGDVPDGSKLAAHSSLPIASTQDNSAIWFRAATETQIDIQP
jgi:hypothetical protein